MKPDVYIIKIGSVEEKYLKKIGIRKYDLEEIRNQYIHSYSFGKTVGYRIRGLQNVKDFCLKLLMAFEKKEKLDTDEKNVKTRLVKTIKSIDKRIEKNITLKNDREKTADIVEEYFLALFPNAQESEKIDFFNTLKKTSVKSMDDLEKIFIDIFGAKINGWTSARKDFSTVKKLNKNTNDQI